MTTWFDAFCPYPLGMKRSATAERHWSTKMANPATRLITLIMLLQKQPNQSASQLADKLGVSVRTIQRYVNMLDEMGIPVYAERGVQGGYSLVRGYKLPPLIFSPAEAVALVLGASLIEAVWGVLYAESARSAVAKLENVLPDEQRREVDWAQKTLVAFGLTQVNSAEIATVLQTLWHAIHAREVVEMAYRGRTQREVTVRQIEPYVLVNGWGHQYCIGYCRLRQAMRAFRVDRIESLTPTKQPFQISAEFDLDAYVASDPFFHERVSAELHFAPDVATQALDNRPHWHSLTPQPDGSMRVTLEVSSLDMAVTVVMAHGYLATVVNPPELRTLVAQRAQAIAERHATQ